MWLALQFPQLGLELFAVEPLETATPTVLLEEQKVVAGNPAADASGIAHGSTLATARSICPEVVHFHRDEARELERLRFLAEALYRFSSLVSVEGPDSLVLEIGGSRKLFADAAALVQAARQVCESLGHLVCCGEAATPTAALLLARSGARHPAAAPLCRANLPARQVEQFANMGIHRVGQLLDLPDIELGQRFGPQLVDFLARVRGDAPDPRDAIQPAAEFSRGLHLLEPVRDKDALRFPMMRLLNELEHWLVARQLSAETLCWQFAAQTSFASERQQPLSVKVHFGRGQQRKNAFLNITALRLERADLPEDVTSIRLKALRLQPFETSSHSLFQTQAGTGSARGGMKNCGGEKARGGAKSRSGQEVSAELSELVDQLAARLGRQACHGIATSEQHVPEQAWCRRPEPEVARATPEAARKAGATRPLWLFDPPRPVEQSRLTLLRGPERIHTAWWQESVVRDYYVARHNSGARCWVFVDAHDCWFLHGYFA